MQRVLIVGCPGSGKSCFARALQAKTGLPLYYLDMLYWNADRTTVPKSVFLERLRGVLAQDSWIIDGNYASTLEMRLQACDTVIFLDYPPEVCLAGVAARRGVSRPDLPWLEDGEDSEFMAFIRNFNRATRPGMLALMDKYAGTRITFTCREQAQAWLDAL